MRRARRFFRLVVVIAVGTSVLHGCTKQDRAGLSREYTFVSIELEPVAEISEDTGTLIGALTGRAMDGRGNLYLSDGQNREVRVFDHGGSQIGVIGRPGDGPGEFQRPSSLAVGSNDSLYVYDSTRRRISVFSGPPNWDFVYSFEVEGYDGLHRAGLRGAGQHLVFAYQQPYRPGVAREPGTVLVPLDRNGRVLSDTLVHLRATRLLSEERGPGSYYFVQPPFARMSVVQVTGDGRICYGWTEELVIRCRDVHGRHTIAIQKDMPHLPVTSNDRDIELQGYDTEGQRLIRREGFPETHPAFQHFVIDDRGRFWIKTAAHADEPVPWLIMERGRADVGRVVLPPAVNIVAVHEHIVYAMELGQWGEPRIIIYHASGGSGGWPDETRMDAD